MYRVFKYFHNNPFIGLYQNKGKKMRHVILLIILYATLACLAFIMFAPAHAGEVKTYGPLGPIQQPLEPIQ